MKLTKLKNLFLDTLFPQFCLNCRKEGLPICQDCLSLIELNEYVFCPFCPKPERVLVDFTLPNPQGKCSRHLQMKLNGLFSAASYQQSLVKKIICQFKYPPYLKSLKEPLVYLILAHFSTAENFGIFKAGENSLIIPVPVHKSKKKKRGFNQSALLAEELSAFLNLPSEPKVLVKTKKTKAQAELSRKEREQNLKNAFLVKNPFLVKNKRIFLIDDVATTASTLEECAAVLKKAGAREVWGIVIAREALV